MLELFSPRRVAVPDLRPHRQRVACGSGQRYTQRARKLRLVDESHIRALAGIRSLRSMAADFGVSHETVRRVLRAVETAVA